MWTAHVWNPAERTGPLETLHAHAWPWLEPLLSLIETKSIRTEGTWTTNGAVLTLLLVDILHCLSISFWRSLTKHFSRVWQIYFWWKGTHRCEESASVDLNTVTAPVCLSTKYVLFLTKRFDISLIVSGCYTRTIGSEPILCFARVVDVESRERWVMIANERAKWEHLRTLEFRRVYPRDVTSLGFAP